MTVYLVGAGPGDPGLITVRGLELLRSCDVLVYDRLVAPELVEEAPADALRIGRADLDQAAVNRLLVELGRSHRTVVRLKGGDPYVFGRGYEEAIALERAGIPFETVPGVSCLSAVPAAAGIPVTHRGVSAQVTVATGCAGGGSTKLDFPSLAAVEGTLVFVMGLARIAALADGLIAAGKEASTPAAVVASGTLRAQRVVVASLCELADAAAAAKLESPALVVIGDVVSLRQSIADEQPRQDSGGRIRASQRSRTRNIGDTSEKRRSATIR